MSQQRVRRASSLLASSLDGAVVVGPRRASTKKDSDKVDAITPEQLERATQQVLDESDLASIKHNLGMGIVTSTFMDKLAAALNVEAQFMRQRRPEIKAMLEAIVARDNEDGLMHV